MAGGAGDAIWLSSDGEVLEAPSSTVTFVRDGVLVTRPADELGILPGTTAEVVRRHHRIEDRGAGGAEGQARRTGFEHGGHRAASSDESKGRLGQRPAARGLGACVGFAVRRRRRAIEDQRAVLATAS